MISCGYSSVGSFRALKDDGIDIKRLIKAVNRKIQVISESDDAEMKNEISADLKMYYYELSPTFEMPWGHENIILTILKYCLNIEDSFQLLNYVPQQFAVEVKNEKTPDILKRLIELAESYIEKKRNKIIGVAVRELNILLEEDKYMISCPYCQKNIKVSVKNGTCVASNFSTHLECHCNITITTSTSANTAASSTYTIARTTAGTIVTSSAATVTTTTASKTMCSSGASIMTTSTSTIVTPAEENVTEENKESGASSNGSPPKKVIVKEKVSVLQFIHN